VKVAGLHSLARSNGLQETPDKKPLIRLDPGLVFPIVSGDEEAVSKQ
jgi:hypothetical protein